MGMERVNMGREMFMERERTGKVMANTDIFLAASKWPLPMVCTGPGVTHLAT